MYDFLNMIFQNWFLILIVGLSAYLIGCINASIVVTKILKLEDIRTVGSGNAGFTNVLRTQGIKIAIFTFVIDFLKGVAAVFVASLFAQMFGAIDFVYFLKYLACLCCVIGHVYPCFFGFKGGKAILCAWSCMLLIDWRVFVALITVFLIVVFCSKIVSLASILAAVSYPLASFLSSYYFVYKNSNNIQDVIIPTAFSFMVTLLVIYRHWGNLQRILNGTEKTISVGKK